MATNPKRLLEQSASPTLAATHDLRNPAAAMDNLAYLVQDFHNLSCALQDEAREQRRSQEKFLEFQASVTREQHASQERFFKRIENLRAEQSVYDQRHSQLFNEKLELLAQELKSAILRDPTSKSSLASQQVEVNQSVPPDNTNSKQANHH
jgi:IS5 family transposase